MKIDEFRKILQRDELLTNQKSQKRYDDETFFFKHKYSNLSFFMTMRQNENSEKFIC